MTQVTVNSYLPALHPGKSADVKNAWAAETSQVIMTVQTLCFLQASPALQPLVVISSAGTGFALERMTLGL